MLHGHAFEAMRQQMLGLFGVAMVTIEDFPDHKVNHLRQGSAICHLEMILPSWTHLRLGTGRPRVGANEN